MDNVLGSGVAGPTRLELATSGVTGRRSNQLNYDPTLGLRHYTDSGGQFQEAAWNHAVRGHRITD